MYHEKFQDSKQEEEHILNSIKFLKQETNLLSEFNETRKLARNYENIASLYLKTSNFRNAIKHYEKVIKISKIHNFYDLLSYSYQQIFSCYEKIDEYNEAKEVIHLL